MVSCTKLEVWGGVPFSPFSSSHYVFSTLHYLQPIERGSSNYYVFQKIALCEQRSHGTLSVWSIVLFRTKVYKARKQLAATDWNYHLHIPEQDVFGEVAVTRKYNQWSKNWNVKIVKQAKDYGYIFGCFWPKCFGYVWRIMKICRE